MTNAVQVPGHQRFKPWANRHASRPVLADVRWPVFVWSVDGPADRWRVNTGTSGSAVVVGESDSSAEVPAFGGVSHEAGIDAVEHELGPPEHLERASVIDVAPGEVDESVTTFAVNGVPSKVDLAVAVDGRVDLEFPLGIGGVTAHEMHGFSADLHAYMDVVEWCAVRLANRPSG